MCAVRCAIADETSSRRKTCAVYASAITDETSSHRKTCAVYASAITDETSSCQSSVRCTLCDCRRNVHSPEIFAVYASATTDEASSRQSPVAGNLARSMRKEIAERAVYALIAIADETSRLPNQRSIAIPDRVLLVLVQYSSAQYRRTLCCV